jgi:hypothetical protein
MVRVDTAEVYDRLWDEHQDDPPPDGLQVSCLYLRTTSIFAPIQYDISRSSACLLMWDMTMTIAVLSVWQQWQVVLLEARWQKSGCRLEYPKTEHTIYGPSSNAKNEK